MRAAIGLGGMLVGLLVLRAAGEDAWQPNVLGCWLAVVAILAGMAVTWLAKHPSPALKEDGAPMLGKHEPAHQRKRPSV